MATAAPQAATLDCPQCGGANPLPSGQPLLRCAFCDATLFVDRTGLVQHYRLPRLLDADGARAALQRWMAGNETVKDLDRKAADITLRAISFPVWMFRYSALVGGGGGEVVRIEPAAPTPIAHLSDLRIPAGELQPYAPREGEIETVASVPIETARAWLGDAASRVSETALVQLPLWECRYRFADQAYTALIEGSTGAALASVYPAKSESPFWLTAAAGLALFGILGLAISNPLVKLLAYGVAAVPLLLLAYWVSRKT